MSSVQLGPAAVSNSDIVSPTPWDSGSKSLRIVIPVFNDWAALEVLLRDLDRVASELRLRVSVSAINDGSSETPPDGYATTLTARHLESIEVVHLSLNVGHQRAIAIGLCLAVDDHTSDAILVMDADGEDSPFAIPALLHAAAGQKSFCVVARRLRRSENLRFRLAYLLYKLVFQALVGKKINFGNFSLFSADYALRLVHVADLWNNLPAAVLRSRLPIRQVPINRAKRYAGRSKMNFTSLVVHGLSGISVHAETLFTRLLLLAFAAALVAGLSAVTVLTLRIFAPLHASPGWASTVIFGMVIILVQVLSIALSSILMLLNSRVQRLIVPIVDYKPMVNRREVVFTLAGVPLAVESLAPVASQT